MDDEAQGQATPQRGDAGPLARLGNSDRAHAAWFALCFLIAASALFLPMWAGVAMLCLTGALLVAQFIVGLIYYEDGDVGEDTGWSF